MADQPGPQLGLPKLAKQTLIYGIGGVALQLVGVLALPIYARVFAPAEYGVIEIVIVAMGVATIVVDAGLASALQRSYFDYSDSQARERASVLFTAIAASLALSVVVALAIGLLNTPLADWFFGDDEYADVIVLAAVTLPIVTGAGIARQVMRVRQEPWRFLASSLLGALAGTAVSIVAVLWFDLGVEGVFIGTLVGSVLSLVYGAWIVVPYVGRHFSRRELRIMLVYGAPLIPAALAMWALQFVDRVMLSKLSDLAATGEYAVANRAAMALLLLVTAFGTAYAPFMLSMFASEPEQEKLVRGRTLTYVAACLALAGVVLSIFAREVVLVLAPDYGDAYKAVWLVSLAAVVYGISTVAMAGIVLTRQTRFLALYSLLAAVVNIGLNFVLIPAWDMVGAAAATLAAYVLLTGLYYWQSQRLYPTPYEPGKILRLAVLTGITAPLGLVVVEPAVLELAIKAGAIAFFVAGLRVTGVLGPQDIAAARQTVRDLLSRRSVAAGG